MPFFIQERSLREADSMQFRQKTASMLDQFTESLKNGAEASPQAETTTMADHAPVTLESAPYDTSFGAPADDVMTYPDRGATRASVETLPERSATGLPSLDSLVRLWTASGPPTQEAAGGPASSATASGGVLDTSWLPSITDLAGQWMSPEEKARRSQAATSRGSSGSAADSAPSLLQPLMNLAARSRSSSSSSPGAGGPANMQGDERMVASAGTRASRYAREIAQVAAEEGVPADVLAAILDTENSGETSVSSAGARGLMQVVPGQGFDFDGEDASDPITSIRQGARALKEKYRMAKGDWNVAGRLYFGVGADAGGTTDSQYQSIFEQNRARYQKDNAAQSMSWASNGIADGSKGDWRKTWGDGLTPNQIDETLAMGLDWESALATCGIAGAIALARAKGSNPSFGETLRMYERLGEWNKDVGLVNGYIGQLRMLKRLGVNAHAEAVDEQRIAEAIRQGKPVQINATGNGGHYYVATAYDPSTGRFNFGNSAAILRRANGQTWFTLDELAGLGVGTPANAIFLD